MEWNKENEKFSAVLKFKIIIMKTRLIQTIIFFFLINSCPKDLLGQNNPMKNDLYRTAIKLNKSPFKANGRLQQALDSSIVLMKKNKMNEMDFLNYRPLTLNVNEIDKITIYKKGSVGQGALTGFLIGAGTGALIGLVSGDDPPGFISLTAGEKAVGLGAGLGIVGTLIGTIAGTSAKVKISINGNQKIYSKYQKILVEYSIVK